MAKIDKDINIKIDNKIIARIEILRNEGDSDADIYIHNVCDFDLKFNVEYINDKNILDTFHIEVKEMDTHFEENIKLGNNNIKLYSEDYNSCFNLNLT